MKTHSTAPTATAQTFDVNETFFSTTDERGVITAGNGVFCRTSGYELEHLIGQPHNIIRHPDMPRLVFRQLWETVRAGRSFMGYVKNQARNGNYYWVFAVVVPINRGFLSVRIKPTSPLLPKIEGVYRRLATKEAAAIAEGKSESQATDSARELLQAECTALGFSDYEVFSHHAFNTEIKSRDAEVTRRNLRLFPAALAAKDKDGIHHLLSVLYGQTLSTYGDINNLFAQLDSFVAACQGIRAHKDSVKAVAEDFRLNALNAQIAAQPLGERGTTLATVAQILNQHGQSLASNVSILAERILHTTTAVSDIASNLSAARIQVEMLLSYTAEIGVNAQSHAALHGLRAITDDLGVALATTLERAFRAIEALQRGLPEVLSAKENLRKDIVFLRVAQISGLTEVSRLQDAQSLHTTFTGLRDQIQHGSRELEQLDEVVDELRGLTNSTPQQASAIQRSLLQMRETLTLVNHRIRNARNTLGFDGFDLQQNETDENIENSSGTGRGGMLPSEANGVRTTEARIPARSRALLSSAR